MCGLLGLLLPATELVEVHGQLLARRELAAPGAQLLTESAVLRLLGQARLQLLALRGQVVARLLPLAEQLLTELAGLPQAFGDALRGLLLLGPGLLQGLLALAHGLLRLLPSAMDRLQPGGRFAGGQLRQLWLGSL
ncbi:hypothetical protein D3C85_519100 [compost metagenome]